MVQPTRQTFEFDGCCIMAASLQHPLAWSCAEPGVRAELELWRSHRCDHSMEALAERMVAAGRVVRAQMVVHAYFSPPARPITPLASPPVLRSLCLNHIERSRALAAQL